ncbi:MAG TPA: SCO family protein [Pyrinomonadaceae bacterium]|nr:SCO family protein [Pyrinomonadaceae bacterium]
MTKQFFILLILSIAVFTTAHAQTPAPKPAAPPAPHDHSHMSKDTASAAEKYFTDVELTNQDGKKVRFYSDVLKGKTVVVNAFFTTCTSVCPPMNRNMEKIQEALGDRVGRDVFLVSITVDPENDTPARMKEYAKKFHAGAGWTFLTGKKENLDWALYKLGQYVENKDDHTTVFIIGNEPTGLWKKAFGMANVAELVQVVESVVNDKGGTQ